MDNMCGIIFFIKSEIGFLMNLVIGRVNARNSQKLSNNDKAFKLKEQLKYLVELYDYNWSVFHCLKPMQEDIGAAVWEPGIFIFETGYKDYLSYSGLTDVEKRKIL